jgi:DNA repair protein RadD
MKLKEYKLRKYQVRAKKDGLEVLLSPKPNKSIVIQPTGAGKSILIAEIAKELDGNVLVVQPSKELLKQNLLKFTEAGGEATIYSASFNSKEISHTTYATDGSLNVEAFKDKKIKYLILDECHLKTQDGSKLNRFIKALNIKNVLGFTASPVYLKSALGGTQLKMMNRVRGKLFNNICHVTQIKELVEGGFWSKIKYDTKNVENLDLEYNSNGSDYTQESLTLNYESNSIEQKIIEAIKANPDRKSILIFVPSVADAIALQKKVKGSEAVFSGMKDKDRERVLNDFKALKLRIVINVNILAVGFDHPELDYIIKARPTASISVYYQQIGRGVRIHENKKDCLVTDLSGNVERFGKLESLTFEEIEDYGWGMFNGENLLSGVPFWEEEIPTKTSLRDKALNKTSKLELVPIITSVNIEDKIWFGKYKNSSCKVVMNKDPKYIAWMLGNKEWDWNSVKMANLKKVLLFLMRQKYGDK